MSDKRERALIESDLLQILEYLNDNYDGSQRATWVGEAFGRIKDDLISENENPCDNCEGPVSGEGNLVRQAGEWILLCEQCHQDL